MKLSWNRLAIGVACGVVIGLALDNIAMGIGIGLAIGIAMAGIGQPGDRD